MHTCTSTSYVKKRLYPYLRIFLLLLAGVLGFSNLAQAQVSGTVFKDFNANGAQENSTTFVEPGMSGVTVKATDPSGAALSVSYTGGGTATNSTGGYSVSGGSLGQIRLEFVLPDDYTFASNGVAGGTTVMFPTDATQNLAANYPADYCQSSPELLVPCYVGQDLTGPFASEPALVRFGYFGNSGEIGDSGYTSPTKVTDHQSLGGTYGVAYSKLTKKAFVGAVLHRHVAYGPLGIGGIYEVDPFTNTVNNWLDIETLAGIDAGTDTRDGTLLNGISAAKNYDYPSFALVGKTSLGDLDISDDGKVLYVVNVFQQSVIAIDVATKSLIGSYPITASALGLTCPQSDFRPWGLKYHKGKLYVGAVCTAQTSQAAADMQAYVLQFDPTNPGAGFSTFFSLSLNYTRENSNNWRPWNETSFDPGSGSSDPDRNPQAILSDIEFDVDGSLILGFLDRHTMMFSSGNFPPDPAGNSSATVTPFPNGDILRACMTSSGLVLEGGAGCAYNVPASGATAVEFYDDRRQGGSGNGNVRETFGGALALLSGTGQVVGTAIDGFATDDNGISWWSNTNGLRDRAYQLTNEDTPGGQGKTSGLGDIELLCNPAPIEIGNRVWDDTDQDGIQDAGELGIAGVQVQLCLASAPTTPIATATTDTDGNYFFSSGTGSNTASAIYGINGLTANTDYQVKFPTTVNGTGITITKSGSNTAIDSDAPTTGIVAFTTGTFGANNHTFDVGYGSIPCSVTATSSAGTCDPLTNQYTVTGTISLTNAVAGTATITDGSRTTTVTVAATDTSVPYTLVGLTSDAASHTVTVSLPGCGTATTTYTAPASCTVAPVCSIALAATPGSCDPANNQYSVTGTISLTNAVAGTATITDGSRTTTVTVAATDTSVPFTLAGLTSDGVSHTISVDLPGCGTNTTTYTAPASCTVAPPALMVSVGTPTCDPATNQYTATGTVSLTNATAGSLTITDNGTSLTVITVTAGQTTASFSVSGISNAASHTVIATLTGGTSASTTYSAPASCTVCSLSLTTTALANGQVGSAYSQTIAVSGASGALTFSTTGSLPAGLSLNPTTGVISGTPTAATTTSFTVTVSDAKSCSDAQALSITTSSAPVCSLTATATPGVCNSATNQYTVTGTISATNTPANQSLTVSVGSVSTVVTLTGNGPVSYTLTGLSSDGLVKTVSVVSSATACGTTTTTYTAPASCTVAPPALMVSVGTPTCDPATNQYTATGTVSLTNATAGTLTITDNGASLTTITVTAGQTTASFSVSGISNAASHTVIATLTGGTSASTTYSAPASCTVCSLSLTTTALANGQVGSAYSQTIAVSGASGSLTFSTTGSLPAGLSLNPTTGVISGTPTAAATSSFTVTVSDAKSCSDAQLLTITTSSAPVCSLTATATPGVCNSATNTYTVTGTVSATNTPANQSLTVSVGSVSTVVTLTGNGPASYTLTGLTSDGAIKTVSVVSSATACGMASVTYTAPASCSIAPPTPPALAVVVTNPICNTATNQYTATGTVSLTNATAGTLTITDNGASLTTITVTAGQTTASFSVSGISNAASHTVIATLTGGTSASTTYSAPASCTVCSLSLTTTALANGQVGSAYSQTIAVSGASGSLTFSTTGSLPAGLSLNPTTGVISGTPTAAATTSFTVTVSDAKSCSDAQALTITTSSAPVCSLTATATPGQCNSATNQYTVTGTISATNTPANQSLTVSVGSTSTVVTLTGNGPVSYTLTGLTSDGAIKTVSIVSSATACGMASVTYTAPMSCTLPVGTKLTIDKLVNLSKAKLGDILTYTLVLTNAGAATANNVVVTDSSTAGLNYVTGSAMAPAATTFIQGNPISTWAVAAISPGQSLSLTFQARADSSGILYNKASIPGDTAIVCTTIPVKVCTGELYTFRLEVAPGRSSYKWYRNGVELVGQTTNILDVSSPGSYSLAVDNTEGKCPDFSCCPFIVEEDTLPTFRAVALPVTCVGATAQANGQIVLSGFNPAYTYQYSLGSSFNPAASLSGAAKAIPASGVIVSTLANPTSSVSYTVRVYNQSGCYQDVTVQLSSTACTCPPDVCTPFVIKQTKRGPRIGGQ